jgi:hypothetical protein
MSEPFPAPLPHTEPQQVHPDIFIVRGGFDMAPMMRITRNMVILRHEGELTLVNSVRPTDAGKQAIEALGPVKHLVRIGAFHGADDPWFRDHYDLTFWTPPGMDPAGDQVLGDDNMPPLPGLRLIMLERARQAEACLFLEREGGVLISCDSVQNWEDTQGCSLAAKAVVNLMGFKNPASPGKPWMKVMQDRNGPDLKADFERLHALDAQTLLPGHGNVMKGGVSAALGRTIARLWPS